MTRAASRRVCIESHPHPVVHHRHASGRRGGGVGVALWWPPHRRVNAKTSGAGTSSPASSPSPVSSSPRTNPSGMPRCPIGEPLR
jgi:hypothetical protein